MQPLELVNPEESSGRQRCEAAEGQVQLKTWWGGWGWWGWGWGWGWWGWGWGMFWSFGFHRLVQLHLSADPNLWVDQVCDRAQQPRSICRQYNATFVQVRFLPTMAWNNNGTQYMEQKLNFPPKFNACNFTFTCSPLDFSLLANPRQPPGYSLFSDSWILRHTGFRKM